MNGNECGRETKVMRVSEQPSPVWIMIAKKEVENVE
jgi:hypothetical protein